jgi:hypothetical protein
VLYLRISNNEPFLNGTGNEKYVSTQYAEIHVKDKGFTK